MIRSRTILHSVEVRGREHVWLFDAYATPENAQEWRDDGLIVNEIVNRIPKWYVDLGLPVRAWCFVQDVLHFKNPWSNQ